MSGRCTAHILYAGGIKVDLRTHKVFHLTGDGQVRRVRNAKAAPETPTRVLVLPAGEGSATREMFSAAADLPAGAFTTTMARAAASGRRGRAQLVSVEQLARTGRFAELAATLSSKQQPVTEHEVRLAANPHIRLPPARALRLGLLPAFIGELTGDLVERTTDPELLRIAAQDPQLADQAARNPHCPPDVLEELMDSTDLDVLAAVAANPALPAAMAWAFIQPGDFYYFNDSYFSPADHAVLLWQLARHTTVPEIFDAVAAQHPDAAIQNPAAPTGWLLDQMRPALAACPPGGDTVPNGLSAFASSSSPEVVEAALAWSLEHLASGGHAPPVLEVIRNETLTAGVFAHMVEHNPDLVFNVLQLHIVDIDTTGVPAEVLDPILAFHQNAETGVSGLLHVPTLPSETLEALYDRSQGADPLSVLRRRLIAYQSNLPLGLQGRLAGDPDPTVRKALITCYLSERLLRHLADDPDPAVRAAAGRQLELNAASSPESVPTPNPERFELLLDAAEAARLTTQEAELFHSMVADWAGDPVELTRVVKAALRRD